LRFLKLKIAECGDHWEHQTGRQHNWRRNCMLQKKMLNVLKRRGGGDTNRSKIIMEKQADFNVTHFEKHFYPKTYKLGDKTIRVENEYFQTLHILSRVTLGCLDGQTSQYHEKFGVLPT